MKTFESDTTETATLYSIDGLTKTINIPSLVPHIHTKFGGIKRVYLLRSASFGEHAEYRECPLFNSDEEQAKMEKALRGKEDRIEVLQAGLTNMRNRGDSLYAMKENYRRMADKLAEHLEKYIELFGEID